MSSQSSPCAITERYQGPGMTASFIAFLSLFMLAAGAEGAAVEATKPLNLRVCPSTTCRVVMTVPAKKGLEELGGSRGDWVQVQVVPEGTVGWVHSGYVARVAAPLIPHPPKPKRIPLYPQAGTFTRLSTHVLTLLLLLVITLFSPIRRSLEKRAGQASTQAPLRHLVSDPKIVISWIILIFAGIAGTMLVSDSSQPSADILYIAQFFGYSGWALFWGIRPCGRLWVKVAKNNSLDADQLIGNPPRHDTNLRCELLLRLLGRRDSSLSPALVEGQTAARSRQRSRVRSQAFLEPRPRRSASLWEIGPFGKNAASP